MKCFSITSIFQESSTSPAKHLSLLLLTQIVTTLLLILTGQRGQTLHLLELKDVECSDKHVILRPKVLLKTSKPGKHLSELVLPRFSEPTLCPVTLVKEYISRTLSLRSDKTTRFLITTQRPHVSASRDSISRWVRNTLTKAGIDTLTFTPHSTRSAATSAAARVDTPLDVILKSAGWASDCNFRKFYDKPVTRNTSFANAIFKHV